MADLSLASRLERRWAQEVQELLDAAARSGWRLAVTSCSATSVELDLECVSAFNPDGRGVEVRPACHELAVFRTCGSWPAEPVTVTHLAPRGIWHPNILPNGAGLVSAGPALESWVRALAAGAICYGHAGPQMRLVHVVTHVYNLLGYRYGAFSQAGEHLNPAAIQWVQAMLAEGRLPLERRPLIAR